MMSQVTDKKKMHILEAKDTACHTMQCCLLGPLVTKVKKLEIPHMDVKFNSNIRFREKNSQNRFKKSYLSLKLISN